MAKDSSNDENRSCHHVSVCLWMCVVDVFVCMYVVYVRVCVVDV